MRACKTCDFFAVAEEQQFQCRESAPQLLVLPMVRPKLEGSAPPMQMIGTWPPTSPTSWCGKWCPKQSGVQ